MMLMCMCNKGIACLSQSSFQSDTKFDHQGQAVYLMDSPSTTAGSVPSSNDENPRVKFLCSFSGSILPRPQDGKLRYVGGETRIVSVPRDITFEELMGKMRELYEGATVLKYQQPDEDLDALVSVVDNDDVTNMMEEYDKLGSGDGFTRLRIFLFSHPDQDGSSHFVDGDERDTERRYVDALNSLNESPESRKQQLHNESLVTGPVDDINVAEQYFNQMSLEGSLHNQRNNEMLMPQFNLRHLTIPQTQRYNEMESPWSPAYYSPRHHGHHDPRPVPEFPTSPSSARYRLSEEYGRQQVNHQSMYEHQPQVPDNMAWLPTGPVAGDKTGFPGNIFYGPNAFEGNSICEHCRMTFQRNQAYPDSPWKHGEQSHLEQPNTGSGFHQIANLCADCPPNRDTLMLNADAKLHHGFYTRDQNDPRSFYNENHTHERGWILQHQLNPRAEESRSHVSGVGRLNDHYVVDGSGINIALGHGTISDGHHVPASYVNHEDPRYIRAGPELGNEVLPDQCLATGSHIHIPPLEERMVRYGNLPYAYGADNLYQVSHGHAPAHCVWKNVHNQVHGGPSYEASSSPHQANGTVSPGFIRGSLEGSPRFCIGVENQNHLAESSHKVVGIDETCLPEYSYDHALKLKPNSYILENQHLLTPDHIQSSVDMLNFATPSEPVQVSDLINERLVSVSTLNPESRNDYNIAQSLRMGVKSIREGGDETNYIEKVEESNMQRISAPDLNKNPDVVFPESVGSNCLRTAEECGGVVKVDEDGAHAPLENEDLSVNRLSFLPELIASVKKAALEGVEDVKVKVQENADSGVAHDVLAQEDTRVESEPVDGHGDLELDSDNDNINNSKIEPTKAEAEAIAKGLQTIKNDDLEEIRELGSGTYGAVYHGKWKGSDVAVKRIKASCFAGRPSERERLIADFWKEALLLSSLHHPNVVSFYGIVRDGPDGSLATVTEFMVNGSLKQFLQKKDRTIDRRKRLIIAMDAAFGMEYLHGKNIVHFDLKCENLLVNMRDPHRPVCKIGDLGLSKVKQHTLVSGGVRGTLPWMAPELLSGKSNMVTEKIDVYSFGIVMWELLTGEEPYADMHCASIIGGIVNNTLRPQIPTWCDPEWKSLMERSWASDPTQRPSFSEISQRLRSMAAAINVK
ncbi:uncharacterized protein LOC132278488 [Cornus florida]|uniref:uncharacterized protein LOC132278488 n=1 Tax=Cornus florida TaxID=4283 RepID=UPI0028992DC1|nr:uncharacterized protein LOC132278488 [Cornus florida]